jgi:hypothetical protein
MAADAGKTELMLVSPSVSSAYQVHTLVKDMRKLATITLNDKFSGYVKQMPWGPMNDVWWAVEYNELIRKMQLLQDQVLVVARTEYDRPKNNAILKTLERAGRDLAAQKAFLLSGELPWEFTYREKDNPTGGYWSSEHRTGPEWPLGDDGIPPPGSIPPPPSASASGRDRRAAKAAPGQTGAGAPPPPSTSTTPRTQHLIPYSIHPTADSRFVAVVCSVSRCSSGRRRRGNLPCSNCPPPAAMPARPRSAQPAWSPGRAIPRTKGTPFCPPARTSPPVRRTPFAPTSSSGKTAKCATSPGRIRRSPAAASSRWRSATPSCFSRGTRKPPAGVIPSRERPPKKEELQQMEADYPTLFDPPLPAPISALEAAEADGAAGEESAPRIETGAAAKIAPYQSWRGSGKAADVAVYRTGQGIERISPGTRHFCAPAMSEAGIALQCARGWPYGYEMLVWRPGAPNLVQITTNYFYVQNPDIHGNELVFQGWDGNDYEIFRYRFDTEQIEQITNNQFDDGSPVVWDGRVAWIAHPTVTAEIFCLVDGVIRKISEGTQDNSAPSIWKDKVVWQGYDDTDLEIYYFNGRRAIKLTSNTWTTWAPAPRRPQHWMSYVDNWMPKSWRSTSRQHRRPLTNNAFEDPTPDERRKSSGSHRGDGTSTNGEPKERGPADQLIRRTGASSI